MFHHEMKHREESGKENWKARPRLNVELFTRRTTLSEKFMESSTSGLVKFI